MRHAANAALFLCAASSLFKTTQAVYFYMYSGPNFDWIKNCSVNHAKSVEALRHNMYAGEVLFQERLEHHPEREPPFCFERSGCQEEGRAWGHAE